jgi:hypothetical protein
MLGPVQAPSFEDLAGETVRVYLPQPGGRPVEQPEWSTG